MRWPPLLLWTFLLASAPAQEAPETREFPLVDLVRAADGKIGVYAINLKTGQEIGHNAGMPYHLGRARSIPVAAAALAKLRAAGLPLSHPLPYPETSFRGFGIRDQSHVLLRPRRDERHARPWPVNAIVEAAIRFEDLSALDLLIDYVTPEGVNHWLEKTAKIQGFGPITTVAAEEKLVFGIVNKRFHDTTPHALARWYRNGETKAIVPAFFVSDPRSDRSFRSDLARARRTAAGLKENSVSPRALASLLMHISRGTAGHPDDCKFLWRLLEGSRPLRFTHPLPLSWRSGGRDGAGHGFNFTAGVTHTGAGLVALSIHADGYGWPETAEGFLRGISRAVVKAMAPKAEARPRESGGLGLQRGVDRITLIDHKSSFQIATLFARNRDQGLEALAKAATETFRSTGRPSLAMRVGSEQEQIVVVRWFLSSGRPHHTERRVVAPGKRALMTFVLGQERRLPIPEARFAGSGDQAARIEADPPRSVPLPTGDYRVRAAVDGREVFDSAFWVIDRK